MPATGVLIVAPDFHNAVVSVFRAASKRVKSSLGHRLPTVDAGWDLAPIGWHDSRKFLAIVFE